MGKAIDKITKGTQVKRLLEDKFKVKLEVRSEQTVGKGTMVIVKPGFKGLFDDDFVLTIKKACPEFDKTIKVESIRLNIEGWRNALQAVFDQNITSIISHPGISIVPVKFEHIDNEKISSPAKARTKASFDVLKEVENLVNTKGPSRDNYTKEDLNLLLQYPGKGGLIKHGAKGTGVLSEFYTPSEIVKFVWGLVFKHGFTEGKVLEPSCGTGRFFPYYNNSQIDAFEIDPVAGKIAKILFPKVNITIGSFETLFFTGHKHTPHKVSPKYSLIIGNPPYEEYKSEYSGLGEKDATGVTRFDQYFILRGLDLLLPGGLMAFIIPSNFIRNEGSYNKIKEKIFEKAKLIDAYRLPNAIFPTTYVGTDVIILKRKS